MDLTRLAVWRTALLREGERLVTQPGWESDDILQRRLRRIEAEIEMIEDRIKETVGSSD